MTSITRYLNNFFRPTEDIRPMLACPKEMSARKCAEDLEKGKRQLAEKAFKRSKSPVAQGIKNYRESLLPQARTLARYLHTPPKVFETMPTPQGVDPVRWSELALDGSKRKALLLDRATSPIDSNVLNAAHFLGTETFTKLANAAPDEFVDMPTPNRMNSDEWRLLSGKERQGACLETPEFFVPHLQSRGPTPLIDAINAKFGKATVQPQVKSTLPVNQAVPKRTEPRNDSTHIAQNLPIEPLKPQAKKKKISSLAAGIANKVKKVAKKVSDATRPSEASSSNAPSKKAPKARNSQVRSSSSAPDIRNTKSTQEIRPASTLKGQKVAPPTVSTQQQQRSQDYSH